LVIAATINLLKDFTPVTSKIIKKIKELADELRFEIVAHDGIHVEDQVSTEVERLKELKNAVQLA
jgi:hypothetical protein